MLKQMNMANMPDAAVKRGTQKAACSLLEAPHGAGCSKKDPRSSLEEEHSRHASESAADTVKRLEIPIRFAQ